jgi:hypothetical protein
MATPLFSKLISIVIDGSTVACATDFTLTMNKDMIATACLSSTGAKTQTPDMYGWTVGGNGLQFRTVGSSGYGVFNMANSLLNSDASVSVSIIPDVSLNQYFSGAGYFTSISQKGGVGAAMTYSFEIVGDGPLTIKTTS